MGKLLLYQLDKVCKMQSMASQKDNRMYKQWLLQPGEICMFSLSWEQMKDFRQEDVANIWVISSECMNLKYTWFSRYTLEFFFFEQSLFSKVVEDNTVRILGIEMKL